LFAFPFLGVDFQCHEESLFVFASFSFIFFEKKKGQPTNQTGAAFQGTDFVWYAFFHMVRPQPRGNILQQN